MRFVLAIVSFVIGVVLVGLGVGQRTIFAPPTSTVAATSGSSAGVTVIPGTTLDANPGHQHVRITGASKDLVAVYGTTTDVDAWVGDARHQTLRYDAEDTSLRAKTTGSERSVPDPAGSDLWSAEYSGSEASDFTVELPSSTSLLLVDGDGTSSVGTVSVTWPRDTSTPLVGPLMTAGGFFVALGIALYVWAILHQRRLRGPRRRSGGGRPPRVRGSRRAAAAGAQVPPRGRRGRRMVAVVPVVLVAGLTLAGCSSEYWPHGSGATPTPTPTATESGAAETAAEPTAATAPQIKRIVGRIAEVAAKADSDRNADLAAERFTGPALALRKANYTIRGSDTDVQAPPAIPSGDVTVAVPQQTDSWPRTVFVVVQDPADKDTAPQALTLVQESARSQYKVDYDVALEAGATFTDVPPVSIGAAQLSPDVKLLTLPPGQIAGAYADILANDTASQYADTFSSDGDDLRSKIGKPYKDSKSSSLPSTAKIEYSSEIPENASIALATNKAGALVSTTLDEIEKVTPTQAGAEVNTEGAVKALSGVGTSTKGISATYGVQLLFYVPPVGTKSKIELLGFSQGLIAASEVQ
ncbi:hypothetical protein [Curtobacterium sp. RRHDQ10]|uniref:hypothetical protein n=1 Tax=Curtobacterium phyllosphaerae TaxID=3413379 RepID=UPI003BF29361